MIIGFTQGTFDMFHIGHLNLIRHAKEQCDYLIVGVNADKLVEEYKHKTPVVCQENRMAIVGEMRHVDEVVLTETLDKKEAWNKYHFDKIFIGDDWKGNPRWEETGREMKELGAELVWLPHTKDVSSTLIRQKIKEEK
jgi:glycerol-3-phosphate cytidylyltransferase